MKHDDGDDDDDDHNTCLKNDNNNSPFHLMNQFHTDIHKFMWSYCSYEYLTQFLESGSGDCLLAKPREKFDETRYGHLGEQYSLTKMCEFAFGPKYYALELNDRDKCGTFLCYDNTSWWYTWSSRPLMVPDGTTCGDNKICYAGECISSNEIKPINGGWSDYGDFGECSRTCGGGIKMKYRYCNNPTPMYGGQYCLGNEIYYEICATDKCPKEEPQDFRVIQCVEIIKEEIDRMDLSSLLSALMTLIVNWRTKLAYEDPNEPCVLYCKNFNDGDYYRQNQMIIDGTPCKNDNSHMCVQGVCKKYGCDYKLDSTAELDICGVCNGNSSDLNECPQWVTGPWSPCSVTIGEGEEVRQVTCQIGNTIIDNSSCKRSMPVNKKICKKYSSIDNIKNESLPTKMFKF
ncbi:A disintegrin and metalloproteinase with thrombospondin motifs 3-like [Aphidius gifuensis]|uniref:A disintegrin and metalloproteinase with thrombospondin motifs 3-like n=1 Tax=Aphidius gifuensis TaxID=684658 RepID=UPI001CDD46EB|nr:A disintegrin and metalloproteinase with thrombospondin motifs 3-like [Aphidius gifuensis]